MQTLSLDSFYLSKFSKLQFRFIWRSKVPASSDGKAFDDGYITDGYIQMFGTFDGNVLDGNAFDCIRCRHQRRRYDERVRCVTLGCTGAATGLKGSELVWMDLNGSDWISELRWTTFQVEVNMLCIFSRSRLKELKEWELMSAICLPNRHRSFCGVGGGFSKSVSHKLVIYPKRIEAIALVLF